MMCGAATRRNFFRQHQQEDEHIVQPSKMLNAVCPRDQVLVPFFSIPNAAT